MARTDIGSAMASRIADRNVFPVYFVLISWDTGGGNPLLLCSSIKNMERGAGSGEFWKGVGLRVGSGNMNQITGRYTVTLPDVIPGDANKVSDYLASQGRVGARIALYYDDLPDHTSWSEADAIDLIDGKIVGAPRIQVNHLVTLTIAREITARRTPFVTWGPPTNNHDRPPGARIRNGGLWLDVGE